MGMVFWSPFSASSLSPPARREPGHRIVVPPLDTAHTVPYIGTMSKHSKTLDQIRERNGGLHWNKVESLLKSLGAEFTEGRRRSVRIVIKERRISVHRPHPRPECGRGLVTRIRELLDDIGEL